MRKANTVNANQDVPAAKARVIARVTAVFAAALAHAPEPGLHIVATPIGNLADMTLRAIAALAGADCIYCEDTRHSRTLLAHYGIGTHLNAYHEHNAAEARPAILARLVRGERVALISDAGTPLVSDPGYKLVRAALDAGHAVTCLPGPSAPLAALAQSGLPTDAFLFAGFLPTRQAARRTRLAELKTAPATLILFEAPSRVVDCLGDIAAMLGCREVAVARELTKLHEEVRRGTAEQLAASFAETAPRGEFVILVAPPSTAAATEVGDSDILAALETAGAGRSFKDAVVTTALALGVAKSRVYDLGIAAKRARGAAGREP